MIETGPSIPQPNPATTLAGRAAIEATKREPAGPAEAITAPRVDVPLPDLSRFNQLLSSPTRDSPVSVISA